MKNSIQIKIFLLILYLATNLLHVILFYLLIPVGFSGDQRLTNVNLILQNGNLKKVETTEDPYYKLFPAPWLISSIISLVTSINSSGSLLMTYVNAYTCMLIFSILLVIQMKEKNRLSTIALIAIVMAISIYLHRPFRDLIASSVGELSLVITLYLFISDHNKRLDIVLLLTLPLLMIHGLSIYYTTVMYLLLSLIFVLVKFKALYEKAFRYAIIIFIGTWLYQVNATLINLFLTQSISRWNQLLSVLLYNPLARSITPSILEQQIHYVYSFDQFITYIAYAYLPLLTSLGLFYFFYKIRDYDALNKIALTTGLIATISFLIAFIFAYKGIENAIARYLYIYASPLSILTVVCFFSKIQYSQHKIATLLKIFMLVIGIISITESFYTPYASLISIPDPLKFEKLYIKYYGPSRSRALASWNKFLLQIINPDLNRRLKSFPLYRFCEYDNDIIYNDGFLLKIILK